MEPHNRLLMRAARDVLRPMGLSQKGRSRVLWDDHGSWLIQVEFQPSGFGPGSYLNVGVGWLWTDEPRDHVAFDHGYRVKGLTVHQSPERWEAVAYSLAHRAAGEVAKYRELIPDLRAAAAVCAQDDLKYRGWHTWYSAVASGLVGDISHSRDRFAAVIASSDDRDWWVRVQNRARAPLPSAIGAREAGRLR
jgi:hypothetical protein